MKNMRDIIFDVMTHSNTKFKLIDVPNYYNFEEMLDEFLSVSKSVLDKSITPNRINVICVTEDACKTALEKGFNTYYLYDLLDFTNDNYYFIKKIVDNELFILESCDNIESSILLKLNDILPLNSSLFAFIDSFIPRRYFGAEDITFMQEYKPYSYKIECNRGNKSTSLYNFLNRLRGRKIDFKQLMEQFEGKNGLVRPILTNRFELSEVDITRPIFTPHVSIVKDLNLSIRKYLGLIDFLDPYRPNVNEWIVSHGPSVAYIKNTGKEINLPIGYRLKIKSITNNNMENNNKYIVDFEYKSPTGIVKDAYIVISRTYLQYMSDGNTNLKHDPNSYNYFYGYVLSGIHSLNDKHDDIDVFYDHNLSFERRDLYTCVCAAKNSCRIFYNLNELIKIVE